MELVGGRGHGAKMLILLLSFRRRPKALPCGEYMLVTHVVENEHYSTVSGLIRLVISLE